MTKNRTEGYRKLLDVIREYDLTNREEIREAGVFRKAGKQAMLELIADKIHEQYGIDLDTNQDEWPMIDMDEQNVKDVTENIIYVGVRGWPHKGTGFWIVRKNQSDEELKGLPENLLMLLRIGDPVISKKQDEKVFADFLKKVKSYGAVKCDKRSLCDDTDDYRYYDILFTIPQGKKLLADFKTIYSEYKMAVNNTKETSALE